MAPGLVPPPLLLLLGVRMTGRVGGAATVATAASDGEGDGAGGRGRGRTVTVRNVRGTLGSSGGPYADESPPLPLPLLSASLILRPRVRQRSI